MADGKKILERKTFHILYIHTHAYTYYKNEVSNSLDGFYVLKRREMQSARIGEKIAQHQSRAAQNIEKRQHHFFIHLIY